MPRIIPSSVMDYLLRLFKFYSDEWIKRTKQNSESLHVSVFIRGRRIEKQRLSIEC